MAQKNSHPDYMLLGIISILVIWGIFTVSTISFPLSLQKYGNPWKYLFHQISMLAIGISLGIIFFKISLRTLKKWAPLLFFLNLILLFFVFLPKIGIEIGGARRWIGLGSVAFQPSEFLKISFILYFASWLSTKLDDRGIVIRKKNQALIVFLIILAILGIGLILQPDMSTAGIILITALLMYFVAPTPFWHSLLIIVGGAGAVAGLIKIAPYRLARIFSYFHPEADPLGISYQIKQALIAIGSGRIFGIEGGWGWGLSRQKFGFLPHSMTDSIFAIIGEELGFFGSSILIVLFLVLLWRGLKIAKNSQNSFKKLLAFGIVIWITLQAFLNIGGITGILPLAGIPLPFFSYGGSHLIAEMIGVGIFLNISKNL